MLKRRMSQTYVDKMQKPQSNKEIMGRLGEECLAARYDLVLSDDKYDMEKDAKDADGLNVEIKTQNRHPAGFFTVNIDGEECNVWTAIKCGYRSKGRSSK